MSGESRVAPSIANGRNRLPASACGNGAFAFECGEPTRILNRWPGILATLMRASNVET